MLEWVTPNRLSWLRIWVIPLLWLAYLISPLVSVALYIVACLTDVLDGYLARKWNMQTEEGKRLDEVADKLLIAGSLALLFADDLIPFESSSLTFWCVVVIVLRECLVTTLREVWSDRAKLVPSLLTAKMKTLVMMPALGMMMVGNVSNLPWADIAEWGNLLLQVSAIFAVISGVQYVWAFLDTEA